MQTKTIRVRKSTVFLLVIFILGAVMVTSVVKSYTKYSEEQDMTAVSAPAAGASSWISSIPL